MDAVTLAAVLIAVGAVTSLGGRLFLVASFYPRAARLRRIARVFVFAGAAALVMGVAVLMRALGEW